MSSVRYHRPVPMVFAQAASGNLELPEGWLLLSLTITLIASGGAIGAAAPTVTTTGLSGLSLKLSGVVAQNAVDRLDWRPMEPLKIDSPAGATVPLVTFPAIANGLWHCVALVRPE